jgi:hypothetical protein
MLKDALALIAFATWLAVNVWLWAAEISIESRFVRSMPLAVVGYAGFFGYLAYRERD